MKRLACLLAALAAVSVRAEVSADRNPDGSLTAYFEPADHGPWERVRPEVEAADILNEQGDTVGDAWPVVYDNRPLGRPEAVWSTAGQNADIVTSHHDGTGWTVRARISQESGADTVPTVGVDAFGNRFVAWDRQRNERHSVQFTALASDGAGQTAVKELSSRPRQGHAPSLAVADDGLVWVAYEEAMSSSDPTLAVGIDRVEVPRREDGSVPCSGEVPIDVARSGTIMTHRTAADGSIDARITSENGEVWVTWIDSASDVGYSQLVGGAFGPAQYRGYSSPGDIARVRADIREDILGL